MMKFGSVSLAACILIATTTNAFVLQHQQQRSSAVVEMKALWRNWIPSEAADLVTPESKKDEDGADQTQQQQQLLTNEVVETTNSNLLWSSMLAAMTIMVTAVPQAGIAVSGGGLDYANLDITGQDFSNSAQYKGKDFTQVIAKGTNFAKSNLQGCRFYKAYLVNADFTGADIRGASMEDTSMDGASLKNALAAGSYFGDSILDVGTLENADFTDAQIPMKVLPRLCARDDMAGTNPITGVDTRDSAMCL